MYGNDYYYIVIASLPSQKLNLIIPGLKRTTLLLTYTLQANTLDSIKELIQHNASGRRLASIAFMLECSAEGLYLSKKNGGILLNESSWKSNREVVEFFQFIRNNFLVQSGCFDFLNVSFNFKNIIQLQNLMSEHLKIHIRYVFESEEIEGSKSPWETYCNLSIMRRLLASGDNLADYEKIRTVGKGAFGTAILYRNNCGTLVVIKEINIMELTAVERQMALNEVQVLSVLNHPNIIRYFRSFEKEGVLMIEMEYANGGTLSQFLAKQSSLIPEKDVIFIFQQIVSAIDYMHSQSILHRDLKSANIFLNINKTVKVGDFGISKVMTTKAPAQTVLGTPYYISPEMCEGKQYDQKSDIWALGCILYEMACLQKPFQGSNLPALVNNIMKGEYQPIPKEYSTDLKLLVEDIIKKEPLVRPSTQDILLKIQLIENRLKLKDSPITGENDTEKRSVLYELSGYDANIKLDVIPLPPKIVIKQVAVSSNHYLVLTRDYLVYSWGAGVQGQLGHGNACSWCDTPTLVKSLQDRKIKIVAAGDGFSIFVNDSGMLMSCGDGNSGCLGHSDWVGVPKPKLVEKLLHMEVTSISCGPCHVAIITKENEVYTWGRGQSGALGLGDENDRCYPCLVTSNKNLVYRSIHCGFESSMLITSDGNLWAAGSNYCNRLGLSKVGWFISNNIEKSLTFAQVFGCPTQCVDVSLGPKHTVVLTSKGQVFSVGNNEEGQVGHEKRTPNVLDALKSYFVTVAQAGSSYSAACTADHAIIVWGKWPKDEINLSHASNAFTREWLKTPTEILGLYSSPQQLLKGRTLCLEGIKPLPHSLLVWVLTSAPYSTDNGIKDSFCAHRSDKDVEKIPDFIRAELAESEEAWKGD